MFKPYFLKICGMMLLIMVMSSAKADYVQDMHHSTATTIVGDSSIVEQVSDTLNANGYESNHATTARSDSSLWREQIVTYAKSYLNKPYCYSGNNGKCFDCSGFVQKVFSQFQLPLPHSSSAQATCGQFVSMQNVQIGDLIFFNGRNAHSEDIGHVGIVVQVTENDILFIHSSVKAGVVISSIHEPYYQKRFMCIKQPF